MQLQRIAGNLAITSLLSDREAGVPDHPPRFPVDAHTLEDRLHESHGWAISGEILASLRVEHGLDLWQVRIHDDVIARHFAALGPTHSHLRSILWWAMFLTRFCLRNRRV